MDKVRSGGLHHGNVIGPLFEHVFAAARYGRRRACALRVSFPSTTHETSRMGIRVDSPSFTVLEVVRVVRVHRVHLGSEVPTRVGGLHHEDAEPSAFRRQGLLPTGRTRFAALSTRSTSRASFGGDPIVPKWS